MDPILHLAFVVIFFYLISLGNGLNGPLITVSQFQLGGSYAITCNLSSFDGLQDLSHKYTVESIGIVRLREHVMKEEIAIFFPSLDKENQILSTIPKGIQKTVRTNGNGLSISITLDVIDANCEDGGQYMCMVKMTGKGDAQYSSHVDLKAPVKSKTVVDDLQVTPPFGVLGQTSTNLIGTHIRLSCIYKGQENLTNKWMVFKTSETEKPANSHTAVLMTDEDHCPIYLHNSTYSFVAEESDNRSTYHCTVFNGPNQEGKTSMTFIIENVPIERSVFRKSRAMRLTVDPFVGFLLYVLFINIGSLVQA